MSNFKIEQAQDNALEFYHASWKSNNAINVPQTMSNHARTGPYDGQPLQHDPSNA